MYNPTRDVAPPNNHHKDGVTIITPTVKQSGDEREANHTLNISHSVAESGNDSTAKPMESADHVVGHPDHGKYETYNCCESSL